MEGVRAFLMLALYAAPSSADPPKAGPAEVPTMAAGVYTQPEDIARCEAAWEALATDKSVRVLPPSKIIKLRAKPATFRRWSDREKAELQGVVPIEAAPSCMLPFMVSRPAEKAPIFERVTGLVWLGDVQFGPIASRDIAEVPRRFNALKAGGFSDWRVPTLPEVASVMRRTRYETGWPLLTWKDQWSADRGPGCQWGMGPNASEAWCLPPPKRVLDIKVQPVRTATPSEDPAPRVKAGLVGSAEELAACQRAEWLKFVEGRATPVTSRERPLKMRAAPVELSAKDLAERLKALYLYEDGQRCFVNDYREGSDGTVIDAATGLAWEVASTPTLMKWNEAQAHVRALNASTYLGHADWRLPTTEEAATLIESVQFRFPPMRLDPSVFAVSYAIWTCDLEPGRTRAWLLATGSGQFDAIPTVAGVQVDDEHCVKVVRSIK
jgi:hypothetical protein